MSEPVPGQEDFSQQGRTFRLELFRAVPAGLVDTSLSTFAVFIAIQVFELSQYTKASLVAASSIGMLISLFVVQLARRLGKPINVVAASTWLLGAVGFAVAATSGQHPTRYVVSCCVALSAFGMGAPLISQIYRKHYPNDKRGRLFSFAAMTRASIAGLAAWLIGSWISTQGNAFAPLFWAYSSACIAMAVCVLSTAPVVLRRTRQVKWFDAFQHVSRDRAFRKLLVIWMIFGFGNLMAWALFVEYITNPIYGFAYDAEKVVLITSTIPMLAFISFVIHWGMIFDRLPFYTVRAIVNLFFIAGILTFYLGSSFLTLCLGIGLHGLARGGGNIIWSLWVTRFADSDRVVEYMSVHTFLTGTRGILAPFVAFYLVTSATPSIVSWTSATLILISTLAILPEILQERREANMTGKPA
ncbi:MAG: MFS transporter [Verrucomicrobiales bacterium]